MAKSMLASGNPLAVLANQHEVLRPSAAVPSFESVLARDGLAPLYPLQPAVLQMNLGRMCNQVCKHCHVDAGPDRKEIMTRETMELCLGVLANTDIPMVDLTGGAPEMNPDFRWLVRRIRALGRNVMDRCNLTILLAPQFEDLAEFLAEHEVAIVASLPFYSEANTDRQRGQGVYARSIEALRRLNGLGYGLPGSELSLSLVYNPVGAFLPPDQAEMQQQFKRELASRHGVQFHSLLVIANQPINRFLDFLIASGNYEGYMQRLLAAYNPAAARNVMCRDTISVGWDGRLYDCDFNQMLDLEVASPASTHVRDFQLGEWMKRRIVTGQHCYACTAGQGSSCGGATTA